MTTFAGKTVTISQIKATTATLRYYRAFLRSDATACRDLEQSRYFDVRLSKDQARERLGWLVNVAIQRKAGIPDVACRKQETDYQAGLIRDWLRLRDIRRRVRVYQFESAEVRDRFSHLLARYDD